VVKPKQSNSSATTAPKNNHPPTITTPPHPATAGRRFIWERAWEESTLPNRTLLFSCYLC
jgi:hypothetical protein